MNCMTWFTYFLLTVVVKAINRRNSCIHATENVRMRATVTTGLGIQISWRQSPSSEADVCWWIEILITMNNLLTGSTLSSCQFGLRTLKADPNMLETCITVGIMWFTGMPSSITCVCYCSTTTHTEIVNGSIICNLRSTTSKTPSADALNSDKFQGKETRVSSTTVFITASRRLKASEWVTRKV